MFAGAAREAVFSNPDVIKRINADFIPVALKAALVNAPLNDEEGLLYREIERSKLAPQGICVVNSAGRVLNWALMFDDDESVLAFFDHAKQRFLDYPDAKRTVPAERHMKFPSQKREDMDDSGLDLPVLARHPKGKFCPAEPPVRRGTVMARLFGRALDKDGQPVADTVRQENYIEDRFHIEIETQQKLAKALADAGNGPVKLPRDVTRQWVKQAYMGVLGAGPLDDPGHMSQGELKTCDFAATKVSADKGLTLWRVEGESDVFNGKIDNAGVGDVPGDMHEVKLKWHGFIEMSENRISRLTLSASGKEKLKFNSMRGKNENEVAILPGGHRIDMDGGVRYGILGEPADPERVADDVVESAPNRPQQTLPDEARQQIRASFGSSFLIFDDKIQKDLQLSAEQSRNLEDRLQQITEAVMPFFQRASGLKPEDREKEFTTHRENAQQALIAHLQNLLTAEQLARLRQLELQQEGLFALGRLGVQTELRITEEQRTRFFTEVQAMQQQMQPLLKQAQSGGNPAEIGPKIMKLRTEAQSQIESILSPAQKKKWREIRGKPFDGDR